MAILDGAKSIFIPQTEEPVADGRRKCVPVRAWEENLKLAWLAFFKSQAYTALVKHNLPELQIQTERSRLYDDSEDNESDGSLISYNSSLQNAPLNIGYF